MDPVPPIPDGWIEGRIVHRLHGQTRVRGLYWIDVPGAAVIPGLGPWRVAAEHRVTLRGDVVELEEGRVSETQPDYWSHLAGLVTHPPFVLGMRVRGKLVVTDDALRAMGLATYERYAAIFVRLLALKRRLHR